MVVYLGADHRGFELKEKIKDYLREEGYEIEDVGAFQYDPEDDYPDFAIKVAREITGDVGAKGILVCGSGHGVEIVANRFPEVRAVLGFNVEVVRQGREHEDANVLSLPSEWVSEDDAVEMVRVFLETERSKDTRHARRLQQIAQIRVDHV